MHPFPPAPELAFLIGQELTQICLGRWDVQLHFASGASISVQGEIGYLDGRGTQDRLDFARAPYPPVRFHDLLQLKVLSLEAQPERLTLIFEDGGRLSVASEDEQYECGQIYRSRDRTDPIVF